MDQDARVLFASSYTNSQDDLDLSAAPMVEVTVLWGEQVLDVQHIKAPYCFRLDAERTRLDARPASGSFLLPKEILGCNSVALITATPHGPAVVLDGLPVNTTLHLTEQGPILAAELAARAKALGRLHAGAAIWPLSKELTEVWLGEFRVSLSVTAATKPIPRELFASDGHDLTYFGLSFLSAAGVVLSAAFFSPPLSLTASEGLNRNDLILMQQYLDAAAEREEERKIEAGEGDQKATGGEPGERAQNSEGAMGDNQSIQRDRRYQIKGPVDNPDPHMARAAALQDAVTFGTIALLNSFAGDPHSPTAPWGHDVALGTDATNANGLMWADGIGSAFGSGGLGVSGLGDGGGGIRAGIGVGAVGTFNRGLGGNGEYGFGKGHGHVQGTHRVKAPQGLRVAAVTVSGRLPPQVIQRIVRQNHGRLRLCYERGLTANPTLEGRVNVRFVIGRNGAVTNAANAGSSLPASDVVNCVVRAFYGLSFPSPEGGLVTVSYPMSFSPG